MEASKPRPTLSLRGIAAAPGLASGPAAIWPDESLTVPRHADADPLAERQRLEEARRGVQEDLVGLKEKVTQEAGAAEAAIFEAHAMILADTSLLKRAEAGLEGGLNAEAAWMDAVEFFASQLAALPDPTLSARALDVRDVGQRVLRRLLGKEPDQALRLARPSVIVARDLAPSQTASLDKSLVRAFCTAEGGPTSHTAILARALGLPAVVGLGKDLLETPEGALLLVDGSQGAVIISPDEQTSAAFDERSQAASARAEAELAEASQPAVTRDGRRVEVVANVGSVEDAEAALQFGAEGIGLLRTEFLYLDRRTAPTEDEQVQAYARILEIMGQRPVVVRTLDVGGDKPLPYLDLGTEANPFLGWRAIRMCLDRPEFFLVQLRALLRAGAGHDLRIMFPMVSTLEEVRRAKALLDQARRQLAVQGLPAAERVQVGIMVEVPSVAMLAGLFAREVDFFSIGTNDLTQYTLAAERTNERVAHLSDALHPAVLRQIQRVIEAGHARGIWVGVCGELAGEPEAIPILLGLALDEFSVAPPLIPRAKAVLRQWTLRSAQALAAGAVEQE
ncbi:MAG: phosphoenolpyruvate--protein phosphotransferase, partial [Chloroflexota bacterium]